jgi:hypothetical protein
MSTKHQYEVQDWTRSFGGCRLGDTTSLDRNRNLNGSAGVKWRAPQKIPTANLLGFNLWGGGLVTRKCTPRTTGTVLEPCRNLLLGCKAGLIYKSACFCFHWISPGTLFSLSTFLLTWPFSPGPVRKRHEERSRCLHLARWSVIPRPLVGNPVGQ